MSKILTYSDVELPRAIIQKLIRSAISTSDGTPMGVSKDAKLAFLHAATLFVSYLTSHGIDAASSQDLKILTHEHIIQALKDCGWESWTQKVTDAVLEYQKQTGRTRLVKDDLEDMEGVKETQRTTASDNEPATSDHELATMNSNIKEEDIDTQAPAVFLDQTLSSERSSLSFD